MAQRGKRKARSSSTTATPTSRTPRKRINLNGASSSSSSNQTEAVVTPIKTRSQVEKELSERYQPEEVTIDSTQGSLQPPSPRQSHPESESQPQRSSSGGSSNITLATARSQISTSLRSLTPSLVSWSHRLQSSNNNWSDWVKKRFPQRMPRMMPNRMSNGKGPDSEKVKGKGRSKGKGKAKAVDAEADEEGNLSADESARMIELLSINPWQEGGANGGGMETPAEHDDDDDFRDDRSGVSVEHLLLGTDEGKEEKTTSQTEAPEKDAESADHVEISEAGGEPVSISDKAISEGNAANDDSVAAPLTLQKGGEEEEDVNKSNGIPRSEIAGSSEEKAVMGSDDSAVPETKVGETRPETEQDEEVEGKEQGDAVTTGRGENVDEEEDSPQDEEEQISAVHVDEVAEDSIQDDQQEEGGEEAALDESPSRSSDTEILEPQEDSTGQVSDAEAEEDDQEETILIPEGGWKGVIDLTDSASPEPAQPEDAEGGEGRAPSVAPPRKQPSSFFADGLLAREMQGGSSASAIGAVHQLGQRTLSGSGSFSKALYKPTGDFRKREPIFSRSRKSLAREITNSKRNGMLTSLRRHAKLVLQAPHLDEMLRKKVALNRIVGDDTPDEEVQIRHLREIIARSTASLRPARRHLKEQERLALEAKLLQKRALGIMGRQPLPKAMSMDQDELVKQTFRKEGKIAQMVGAAVESRDIVKLKPGVWLNDEVINFYMKLILKRSDEAIVKRANARAAKKRLALKEYGNPLEAKQDTALVREYSKIWNGIWNCWTFTSFFFTKLSTGGYAGVRQWTRKVDIFTKDIVLLPINISSTHWVCAAINMRRCRFEYYDSMRSKPRGVFTKLREYLQSEYDDKKKGSAGPLSLDGWTYYVSQQSPLQENAFDCGVFACQTLEQISRRNPRDFELKDDLNVEKVVQKSRELAEERQRKGGSDDDDSEAGAGADEDDDEDEEWNFSQANIPYLRQRMVYEIVKTSLLNE